MSLHAKAVELKIKSANRKENTNLLAQIATGERAHERFIEGNMAYVIFKVGKWLDEHPEYEYLKDDLISEGFLVLAKIAKRVAIVGDLGDDSNAQGLITMSLGRAFDRLASHERHAILTPEIVNHHTYEMPITTDILSDILSCCKDQRERRIVILRSRGLTDEQIAPVLGFADKSGVWKIRQEIEKRYQEIQ